MKYLTGKDIENINKDSKDTLACLFMEEAIEHCYKLLEKIYYSGSYHISAIELNHECDGQILERDINELLLQLSIALNRREDLELLKEDKQMILKKLKLI